MLRLMKPKFFAPVHGEYRMQKIHTKLAQLTGVPKENTFILENGDVLALTKDTCRLADHIESMGTFTLTDATSAIQLVIRKFANGGCSPKKGL